MWSAQRRALWILTAKVGGLGLESSFFYMTCLGNLSKNPTDRSLEIYILKKQINLQMGKAQKSSISNKIQQNPAKSNKIQQQKSLV